MATRARLQLLHVAARLGDRKLNLALLRHDRALERGAPLALRLPQHHVAVEVEAVEDEEHDLRRVAMRSLDAAFAPLGAATRDAAACE